MGLLDRLKLNKTKDFFEWLDLILKNELNQCHLVKLFTN